MINPSTLAGALVSKMRAITALVTDMGSVSDRIFAYEDQFPTSTDVREAINAMKAPSMMVVFDGTAQARRQGREVWQHRFSILIRGGKPTDIWTHFVNGVPTGQGTDGLNIRRTEIHSSVYAMDTPTIQRQVLMVSEFASLDYFQIQISLIEKRDA